MRARVGEVGLGAGIGERGKLASGHEGREGERDVGRGKKGKGKKGKEEKGRGCVIS